MHVVVLRRWTSRLIAVGLTFVLALIGPAPVRVAGAETVGSVTGTVSDANGNPVPRLRVVILATGQPAVTTDRRGHYTIPSVPTSGTAYDVQLLAPCGRDQAKRVVVNGAETVNFTVATGVIQAGYRCGVTALPYVEGTSTVTLSGDDAFAEVTMPFGVPFFGASPDSTITVSTNGFLLFSPQVFPEQFRNRTMPQTDAPNGIVAPFWDDLIVDGSAAVRYASGGSSPNRFFVIEWFNVLLLGSIQERLSFEAVLFEDGRIVFNYRAIDADSSVLRERGQSATVGIESPDGTAAVQRSFNQPYLDNDFPIDIRPK
jgi:hypothetical protein